eukprot:CAMPEP_0184327652 /NCGR_PEP_ID=MMETSP1049-20130417/143206_1 /TAXON_ID=77928 /ORGANISM="Proteomonas sulcata, Strain CCMP704" /LENGTH=286 /DNA_ID=CAMNT_0026649917 /DNA_START=90 /DNA_END=950 /DNA_ORIENTATION=+
MRELEEEVAAMQRGRECFEKMHALLKQREKCLEILSHLRVESTRHRVGEETEGYTEESQHRVQQDMARLQATILNLDDQIAPLLYCYGKEYNPIWGYISRAGLNDRSHIMKQIEKHADLYTSRVSNFLRYTPFMYFRSSGQAFAHHDFIPVNYNKRELGYLERIFQRYDSDGNGQIDKKEFMQLAAETQVFQALAQVTDKDKPERESDESKETPTPIKFTKPPVRRFHQALAKTESWTSSHDVSGEHDPMPAYARDLHPHQEEFDEAPHIGIPALDKSLEQVSLQD